MWCARLDRDRKEIPPMNVFTIDADNNITIHATKKAARETGAGVFDTAENFAELIGPDNKRLIEIWNGLTGVTPVKKFTSRAVAARRIFAQVQKLAPAVQTTGGAADCATEASPAPTAAKSAKTAPAKRVKAPKAAKSGPRV